jgi:hypothetical protein
VSTLFGHRLTSQKREPAPNPLAAVTAERACLSVNDSRLLVRIKP